MLYLTCLWQFILLEQGDGLFFHLDYSFGFLHSCLYIRLKINNALVKPFLYLEMLLTLPGFYVPAGFPRTVACENT